MPEEAKWRLELSLAVALFAALALFGAAAAGTIVHDFSRARASLSWPVVDAVVLSETESGARLRYAYSFGGRSYESRRVRFLTASLLRNPIAPQAPGDTVGAYVDPDAPHVSVLAPGGSGFFFAGVFAISGLCVFVGVGGVIRTLVATAEIDAKRLNAEPV